MQSDSGQGVVGGTYCPRHPEQGVVGTCLRCGTFMCDTCTEGGREPLCPGCRERAGVSAFPLDRGNWNFGALWDYSWRTFQREWVMLSVGTLIAMVAGGISQALTSFLPAIGTALDNMVLFGVLYAVALLVQVTVQGVVSLGYLRMVFDVLQGGRADVGRIFSQVHKTDSYLLTILLVFLMVLLPMLVVGGVVAGGLWATGALRNEVAIAIAVGVSVLVILVPLIYFTLPLYLLQPAMALSDSFSPTDIIKHCYAVARGERLSIFGVTMLTVLLTLGGLLACCVGLIPAMALAQLILSGLYLALRTEPGER